MSKTSKEITLPLLPEVGNALLDYIKNSRRQCDLKHVFVSANGAYSKIKSSTLYYRIKYYINLSKIDIKNRKCGNVIKLRDDEPSRYYCLDGFFI